MTAQPYKSLLISVCIPLLLAACTKQAVPVTEGDAEAPYSVTVALGADTKAAWDKDAKGIYADQCRLQIRRGDSLFYDRTVKVNNFRAKFNDIVLDQTREYDFLFWADNCQGAYYNTGDLRNISLTKAYVGGDDRRDAFYGYVPGMFIESMCDTLIWLKRPFAQLNVITEDIPALYEQLPHKEDFEKVLPDSVRISVTKVPTLFNVMTGDASEEMTVEYTAPVYAEFWNHELGAKNTLSMDYFFGRAIKEEIDLVKISFTYFNSTTGILPAGFETDHIPLRRNFRTNVYGNIITKKTTVNIVCEPAWDGENECQQ